MILVEGCPIAIGFIQNPAADPGGKFISGLADHVCPAAHGKSAAGCVLVYRLANLSANVCFVYHGPCIRRHPVPAAAQSKG